MYLFFHRKNITSRNANPIVFSCMASRNNFLANIEHPPDKQLTTIRKLTFWLGAFRIIDSRYAAHLPERLPCWRTQTHENGPTVRCIHCPNHYLFEKVFCDRLFVWKGCGAKLGLCVSGASKQGKPAYLHVENQERPVQRTTFVGHTEWPILDELPMKYCPWKMGSLLRDNDRLNRIQNTSSSRSCHDGRQLGPWLSFTASLNTQSLSTIAINCAHDPGNTNSTVS